MDLLVGPKFGLEGRPDDRCFPWRRFPGIPRK